MTKIDARKIAYKVLYDIILEEGYSNITLNKYFKQNSLDEQDRRFISEIVYGTIKNKIYLEYIIKHYSKGRIKPKVKIILLMGIYQLLFMDKTPNFAIINESVKLAKDVAGNITGKFVNGILRNIERSFNKDNLKYRTSDEQFIIEKSCPKELFDILVKQYGKEKAKSIVLSFNTKSENSIRYNPPKISKDELLKLLGDNARKSYICEDNLILTKQNLDNEYFKKGYYIVQDEASSLVACSITEDEKKNYKILDTCAAPGGKSIHIAAKYFNSTLISCDKYIHKLKLIDENIKKLGVKNIITLEQDATVSNENFEDNFDIVICDVPCSGMGVIKNKPEIKYKITDKYIEDIAKFQYKILEISKNYVKNDGILMYSTCTIDKRENIENIKKFLMKNKNFKLEKIALKNSIIKATMYGVLEILPDEYDCDGFFIAKLRKVEEKC
ncbi:ribosomal RNA small subunit methyltransferase B [Gemella bergeri ATCC 700627]|uniref:16S rRNA (cytosine(967)-C(5))-methyltransferase n=1 Tax=Gemella bergeri ATCC 700627 TaxID=1321820 RepID=U2QTK7_9BACL|nr:16S rRNA (cytosine(967)-C(5))-methyltransferase RsmB [Gemella bergeri]ERK59544.1 ribosomal RNA small subunit methyltransferase B [Gemella bergeri ATCC 700627]